jgi:Icc-related predicted phosphoesterase
MTKNDYKFRITVILMEENVFDLALAYNQRGLSQLSKRELSKTNEYNQTILHIIAQTHYIDFLFVCICMGCDTSVEDYSNRLYSDYLEAWEFNKIKQLYIAYKPRNLRINIYASRFSRYVPEGFSLSGYPLICSIWENNLGISALIDALESGADLDHPLIKSAYPAPEYAQILCQYGWISQFSQYSINNYYKPELWNGEQEKQFKVIPIGKTPNGLFHKSIVCISDTHWTHRNLHIPGGDILVCAGDISVPKNKDLCDYILWMGEQRHCFKIFIAGNHDGIIEKNKNYYLQLCRNNRVIYLEDSGIELYGIKFWGSPWTPLRSPNKHNAFTASRSELIKKWDQIPNDTQILITHCPPYGIGDLNSDHYRGAPYQCGDYGLRKTINRLRNLKIHIFGHQHYGRGLYKGDNGVYFANCSKVQENVSFIFI